MVTEKQAEKVRDYCLKTYSYDSAYGKCVNGIGISLVKLIDIAASHSQDYCVVILLRKKLPKTLNIPSEYQGVRIFTKVIGEIRPL